MPDLHEAVIVVLKEPEEIFALVGGEAGVDDARVFGIEIPKSEFESKQTPRKCIVVRQSGLGGHTGGYARIQKTLLDVCCYGETPYEAELLRLEVNRFLKAFRRRMSRGFLLHSFDLVNGPIPLREPQTEWPYVLETWRCMASET
ncbi:MAG: hypothetical protein PHS14_02885 [Elusimicrobia bacterium]|nr:hypothetical protein [Elusimicrobiota bacterium]